MVNGTPRGFCFRIERAVFHSGVIMRRGYNVSSLFARFSRIYKEVFWHFRGISIRGSCRYGKRGTSLAYIVNAGNVNKIFGKCF